MTHTTEPATRGSRPGSTSSRLFALPALLGLVMLAVSACGGPAAAVGGQSVDDVAFLGDIESQWRSDLGTSRVSVHEQAHCWLARDSKSKEVGDQAWCGPVRHLTATTPGVWDLYRFDANVSDKTAEVSDIQLQQTGATFPADRDAYRADKAEIPDKPESLAAPKPAPAAAGYAARLEQGAAPAIKDQVTPTDGRIIAPDLTLNVGSVGRLDMLPAADDTEPLGPADGQELRVITFTAKQSDNAYSWESANETAPAFSIQTTAGRKGIQLVDSSENSRELLPRDQITVVASIPTGEDAQLVVGVAGVDQTISLRTGERTSKTAAAYYRKSANIGLNRQYPTSIAKVGDFAYRHNVTFTSVDFVPYANDSGWAAQGKVWMQLHYANVLFQNAGAYIYGHPTIDGTKSLTVTDDRGRTVRYGTVDLPTVGDEYDDDMLVLPIADNAKSVTVTYAPTGTFAHDPGTIDNTNLPRSGTYRFKPFTFKITIPQS